MKTYKHIPTGLIYKFEEYSIPYDMAAYYKSKTDDMIIWKGFVNGCKDWKEIFPVEYTILTLRCKSSKTLSSYDKAEFGGCYTYAMNTKYTTRELWVKAFLSCNFHEIYSIRRESDGEVFTIGNTTKGGNKIYSFEIENGVILVRVGNKGHSWADFNQLQKVEKLFYKQKMV